MTADNNQGEREMFKIFKLYTNHHQQFQPKATMN